MTVIVEVRTVTIVTLEARAITKNGDASSVRGFKLSHIHQPRTRRSMDDRATSNELRTWS